MCVNKKVLLGLGVAALAVLAFKPDWFLAALPLMVLALCPLSMVFMMRGMNNSHGQGQRQGQGQGGSSCGMGGKSHTTDTASADPTKLDEKINALQAQLRSLKAAQAQRDATTAEAQAKANFASDAGDARA